MAKTKQTEDRLAHVDPYEKIGILEKLGFGGYRMTNTIVGGLVGSYLLYFFTDVAFIAPAMAGLIMTLGGIWDGINDPLIGFYAINRKFKTGEVSRPYTKYFAIPAALSFVLLFTAIDVPPALKFAFFLIIYLIQDSIYTFRSIPGMSMPTLVSADPVQRLSVNSYSVTGGNVGIFLSSLIAWPLITAFSGKLADGSLADPRRGFFLTTVILGGFMLVGSYFHYFTSKERVKPMQETSEKLTFPEAIKLLLSSKDWIWCILFWAFMSIQVDLQQINVVYVASHVLRDPDSVMIMLVFFLGGAFAVVPFVKKLYTRFGRRNFLIGMSLLVAAAKVWYIFVPLSLPAILLNALFCGAGMSVTSVVVSTAMSDVADLIEWEKGRRIENMISAMGGLAMKIAVSLSIMAVGFAYELAGYNAELSVQPQSAINAINIFFGLVPAILVLLATFCVSRIDIDSKVKVMVDAKAAAQPQTVEE